MVSRSSTEGVRRSGVTGSKGVADAVAYDPTNPLVLAEAGTREPVESKALTLSSRWPWPSVVSSSESASRSRALKESNVDVADAVASDPIQHPSSAVA